MKANANSKKPKVTFTVFIQLPDLGIELSQPGKAANIANGKARAKENPAIPTTGANPPFKATSTRMAPTIGPVQEKDTIANAMAIKNIPIKPPDPDRESTFVAQELGNTISNAPKKEKANKIRIKKKNRLNHTLVEIAFKESAPKSKVISNPKTT